MLYSPQIVKFCNKILFFQLFAIAKSVKGTLDSASLDTVFVIYVLEGIVKDQLIMES